MTGLHMYIYESIRIGTGVSVGLRTGRHVTRFFFHILFRYLGSFTTLLKDVQISRLDYTLNYRGTE